MPKIEEAPTATKTPPKGKFKPKKNKLAEERKVVHPELSAWECWGDKAITPEVAKEILGWEEETEEVKFGSDYHLADLTGKKVRLRNSTRNRPFSTALCLVYVQELLNRRWQINGETVVIGKFGEVISGQHRLAAVVLADQKRQAEVRWEENWGEGPVTLSTFAAVGVEETDEVVNTVDTGKPRSLSDTVYRSEHFADLVPKERNKASRACDWAIRLIQLRMGIKDAMNPRKSHGASLEFLANHLTLRRLVRHVCEEDKGGNISNLLTPGYASAVAYLMAASKSDPDTYVNKAREGNRLEKHLDLTFLDRAESFWRLVGKEGDPNLKAVRERLKLYAKRKDSLGKEIPVSLDEKVAILKLAWDVFAKEGKIPTVAQVTPKYLPGEDGDENPVLKGDYRLGGIDLGDEHDEESADEEEEEDGEKSPEDLRKELEATRPSRVENRKAELVKERNDKLKAAKAERDAKKSQMADAEPPTNGKVQSVTDQIREQYAAVAKDHEGKVLFFKSRSSGGLTTIDDDAVKVAKILGPAATKDPTGFTRFTISKADAKSKLAELLADGAEVVIAEEVPTGKPGEKTTKVTPYTGE